ncbi:MAG: hypothetical protein RLY97_1514 [Pseudomonadota bacterium]|jgi:CRISPR-associated protein Cas2
MAEAVRLYIFAYDMQNDRARARVARILEEEAVRVQGSVFEGILSAATAARLTQRVEARMEPGDRLRVYQMPLSQLDHVHCMGGLPVQQGADYWLL